MSNKIQPNLLLFALFGIVMWFFGNLYEGIVITPNLLSNPAERMQHWQHFFVITNPIFFYIPIAPIAILATVIQYFKTIREKIVLRKHMRYACVFLIFAFVVSIFIISQINLKLFYGNIEAMSPGTIYKLSILWNSLNIVRLLFLGLTIYHLFQAYILKIK